MCDRKLLKFGSICGRRQVHVFALDILEVFLAVSLNGARIPIFLSLTSHRSSPDGFLGHELAHVNRLGGCLSECRLIVAFGKRYSFSFFPASWRFPSVQFFGKAFVFVTFGTR